MQYKILIGFFFLFSCTTILKKSFKVNRKFSFNSKSEYYNYLINKKGFPKEKILFLDSISYINFGQKALMVENLMIYFGSFLNDSVSIKKSPFLKDNQACIGRMKSEIEKNLSMVVYADSAVELKMNLSKFNLCYLYDKSKFSTVNNKKRLKIFLIYYYSFGTYYDKLYKEIEEACLNNIEKTDLFIISVDPVYALKNQ